jgi:hypothetical protein
LRDLTLKREDVFQIAIVFFRPDVRLSASVDQLSINVQPGTCFAHTAFQDMGDRQRISDLTRVLFAAIPHHARSTNDF